MTNELYAPPFPLETCIEVRRLVLYGRRNITDMSCLAQMCNGLSSPRPPTTPRDRVLSSFLYCACVQSSRSRSRRHHPPIFGMVGRRDQLQHLSDLYVRSISHTKRFAYHTFSYCLYHPLTLHLCLRKFRAATIHKRNPSLPCLWSFYQTST